MYRKVRNTSALFRSARRATGPATRRALRVTGWCAAAVPASLFLSIIVAVLGIDPNSTTVVENLGGLVIGVAAWVGISRYGLLDVRFVMNRALVYVALSAVVVVVYLLAAAALSAVLDGIVPRVASTALAVLAVLPLRDRVQQLANRLVYGLRDEPATALLRLGARLDAAGAPEDVLPAAARTVGEALRLRHVEIVVGDVVLASWGSPNGGRRQQIELPFAGETIGHLLAEPRHPDNRQLLEPGSLLDTLVGHVAAAVRAVLLTRALQESREVLVLAGEEERRRLRRELHDGIGPTLAAIGLGLDAAQRAIAHGKDARAAPIVAGLRRETQQALEDIRRIAYDLRPPILDELGLAAALHEQAARYGAHSLTIPTTLPGLPAALEVATYRIAVEAMTNAVRHAPGARITVRLTVNSRLELDVRDDGAGICASHRPGIGITSMRERAAELGGWCTVEADHPSGTAVRAVLPLRAGPATSTVAGR